MLSPGSKLKANDSASIPGLSFDHEVASDRIFMVFQPRFLSLCAARIPFAGQAIASFEVGGEPTDPKPY